MSKVEWQELYKSALLETDWSRMGDLIGSAECSLSERLRELSLQHGGTPEENQAIINATNGLKVLRQDLVAWQREKLVS
ncbi:MAG: hypothetical protein ACRD20_00230 [Terriglobales bacterium]